VHAEIMYNRTAVGFVYNSTGACPTQPGPCACANDSAAPGHFLYTCAPWAANEFPFGSEFAWDSTGQEEIYVWGRWGSPLISCRREGAAGQPCSALQASL
jgi:hypothetical protein